MTPTQLVKDYINGFFHEVIDICLPKYNPLYLGMIAIQESGWHWYKNKELLVSKINSPFSLLPHYCEMNDEALKKSIAYQMKAWGITSDQVVVITTKDYANKQVYMTIRKWENVKDAILYVCKLLSNTTYYPSFAPFVTDFSKHNHVEAVTRFSKSPYLSDADRAQFGIERIINNYLSHIRWLTLGCTELGIDLKQIDESTKVSGLYSDTNTAQLPPKAKKNSTSMKWGDLIEGVDLPVITSFFQSTPERKGVSIALDEGTKLRIPKNINDVSISRATDNNLGLYSVIRGHVDGIGNIRLLVGYLSNFSDELGIIGSSGLCSSGNVKAAQLYIALYVDQVLVDPLLYFDNKGTGIIASNKLKPSVNVIKNEAIEFSLSQSSSEGAKSMLPKFYNYNKPV